MRERKGFFNDQIRAVWTRGFKVVKRKLNLKSKSKLLFYNNQEILQRLAVLKLLDKAVLKLGR